MEERGDEGEMVSPPPPRGEKGVIKRVAGRVEGGLLSRRAAEAALGKSLERKKLPPTAQMRGNPRAPLVRLSFAGSLPEAERSARRERGELEEKMPGSGQALSSPQIFTAVGMRFETLLWV